MSSTSAEFLDTNEATDMSNNAFNTDGVDIALVKGDASVFSGGRDESRSTGGNDTSARCTSDSGDVRNGGAVNARSASSQGIERRGDRATTTYTSLHSVFVANEEEI